MQSSSMADDTKESRSKGTTWEEWYTEGWLVYKGSIDGKMVGSY